MKTPASAALAALLLAAVPAVRAGEPAAPPPPPAADAELQKAVERAHAAAAEAQAAADKARDAAKEFANRLKASAEKVGERSEARLTLDGVPILRVPGGKIETLFEGEGADRVMIVKLDGKEISRVPLPKLDVDTEALPPLAFPNIDNISTRVESHSVNGVSTSRVWVNGKLVYQGPGGGNVSAVSNSSDGRTFVEVKIDGRVVYRAGEGKGAEPRKSGKKAE